MLWIGFSDRPGLIAAVEHQTGLKATVSDGSGAQWAKMIGRDRVVVVGLPVPPGVLEHIFAATQLVDGSVAMIIHDRDGLFDESLVRPSSAAFQYVRGDCANELAAQILVSVRLHAQSQHEAASNELLRKWLIGESRPMQELRALVRLVAPRSSSVLITGETGTGKERVARSIHAASARSSAEMVSVNCGALPDTLIEAELFGHTKGAFTGAHSARPGRFEQANNATLFLDEVTEIPLALQGRLLRVLQERELQRVGSSETIKLNTRIIAASNCDFARLVAENRFREDLYYRLNVVPLHVPALRNRAGDIPELVDHFLEQVCRREGLPAKELSPDAMRRLMDFDWPGNVRQLEHTIEMAVTLSGSRRTLFHGDVDLPDRASPLQRTSGPSEEDPLIEMPKGGIQLDAVMGRLEKMLLEQALRSCDGNKAKAANLLGIKRTTLLYKMKVLDARTCAA